MRIVFGLLQNLVRFVVWLVRRPWRARLRRAPWLWLELGERLEELPRPARSWWRARLAPRSPRTSTAHGLRRLGRDLARVPASLGVVVHVRNLGAGWATLESARDALSQLRRDGRKVVIYLEEGGDQRALFLGSAASELWLGRAAAVTALGPVSRRTYIAPLLRKLGVEIATSAAGDYKSAADGLVRDRMSGPDRLQRSALLDTVVSRWSEAVAPRVGADSVPSLLQEAVLPPERARELGLAEGVGYLDELESALGITPTRRALRLPQLAGAARGFRWQPIRNQRHIAIVRLCGAIGGGPRGLDTRACRQLLRSVRERADVAAAVLFVDSPGGSAVASDLIHREVALLNGRKPVVTVFGDVAASGGYYIAAPTRRIYARATTVTGSIGVISVRAALAALLDRLGVNVESLATTPAADLFRLTTPLTSEEAALLERETARFYARFVAVVAEGRHRSDADVLRVAGGRVWSGKDAMAEGLVDALGGLPEALGYLEGGGEGPLGRLGEPRIYAPSAPESPLALLTASATGTETPWDALVELAGLARAAECGPLAYAPFRG